MFSVMHMFASTNLITFLECSLKTAVSVFFFDCGVIQCVRSVLALGVTDKNLGDASDIISDSSGVGTANSDTTNGSLSLPGTTVVCTESYASNDESHLSIREGDIIEGKNELTL